MQILRILYSSDYTNHVTCRSAMCVESVDYCFFCISLRDVCVYSNLRTALYSGALTWNTLLNSLISIYQASSFFKFKKTSTAFVFNLQLSSFIILYLQRRKL